MKTKTLDLFIFTMSRLDVTWPHDKIHIHRTDFVPSTTDGGGNWSKSIRPLLIPVCSFRFQDMSIFSLRQLRAIHVFLKEFCLPLFNVYLLHIVIKRIMPIFIMAWSIQTINNIKAKWGQSNWFLITVILPLFNHFLSYQTFLFFCLYLPDLVHIF